MMNYSMRNKHLILAVIILISFFISGCSYFYKEDDMHKSSEIDDQKGYENFIQHYPAGNNSNKSEKHNQDEPLPSLYPYITPVESVLSEIEMPNRSIPQNINRPTPTSCPTPSPQNAPNILPETIPTPTSIPAKLPTPTPIPKAADTLDTLIGKSKDYIVSKFGTPKAYETSEYGFTWNVYHNNYANYFMIGIKNERVVGIYSNSKRLKFKNITIGMSRNSVRNVLECEYEGPLSSIRKGNTTYNLSRVEERDYYFGEGGYVTFFYDLENSEIPYSLTAIQIIDFRTEQSFGGYPDLGEEISRSYERIGFYLINSIRVRMGYKTLKFDPDMGEIAKDHSQDMIERDYFSHTSLPLDSEDPEDEGKKYTERITDAGYSYFRCAENLSRGHTSAIYAHESLMNSSGHRKNILCDVTNIGIGVAMTQGEVRMTQIFITYR